MRAHADSLTACGARARSWADTHGCPEMPNKTHARDGIMRPRGTNRYPLCPKQIAKSYTIPGNQFNKLIMTLWTDPRYLIAGGLVTSLAGILDTCG